MPTRDFRYERKFCISQLSRPEVEHLVRFHPAVFSEIYQERWVNNIYFDSLSLHNYFATIDGLAQRTKCRIRWYGELLGQIEKPVLEFKIKEGLVGTKKSFPLPPFRLGADFDCGTILAAFKQLELPASLRATLEGLEPTLLNRYSRKYYQSTDRHFRVTIDTALEYCRINNRGNTFLQRWGDNDIIFELKYSRDRSAEVSDITRHLPFRMTKSSKYVNGIQHLFLS